MNLLLDTHALLWWYDDQYLLREVARIAVSDPENTVYVSAVTAWEIAIKRAKKKLEASEKLNDLPGLMHAAGFMPLPIHIEHGQIAGALPPVHQDPFDRMLIAQAQLENLTLVTRDSVFTQYEINTIQA